MFVDPCAGDTEVHSELRRVKQPNGPRTGLAALVKELCDALGDLLDRVGCELRGGVPQAPPALGAGWGWGCCVGSRLDGVWCSHIWAAFQEFVLACLRQAPACRRQRRRLRCARAISQQHKSEAAGSRHRVAVGAASLAGTCCPFVRKGRSPRRVADVLAWPSKDLDPGGRRRTMGRLRQVPPRCANSRGPARRSRPFMQLPRYYTPSRPDPPGGVVWWQPSGLPRALRAKGARHEHHTRLVCQGGPSLRRSL